MLLDSCDSFRTFPVEYCRSGDPEVHDTRVVYHLHQKPIWFQTVQMERKKFDWKIPFGARAFHFP